MQQDVVHRINTVSCYLDEKEVFTSVKDRFWHLINELDLSTMEAFIHCLYNVVSFDDNWWTAHNYTTTSTLKIVIEIFDLIEGWGFMTTEEIPMKEHGETHRWHIIKI